jgi:hypothetical protein
MHRKFISFPNAFAFSVDVVRGGKSILLTTFLEPRTHTALLMVTWNARTVFSDFDFSYFLSPPKCGRWKRQGARRAHSKMQRRILRPPVGRWNRSENEKLTAEIDMNFAQRAHPLQQGK